MVYPQLLINWVYPLRTITTALLHTVSRITGALVLLQQICVPGLLLPPLNYKPDQLCSPQSNLSPDSESLVLFIFWQGSHYMGTNAVTNKSCVHFCLTRLLLHILPCFLSPHFLSVPADSIDCYYYQSCKKCLPSFTISSCCHYFLL